MTLFAYLLALVVFGAWAWTDHRDKRERDAWWGQWHQARTWHVVPPLFDWEDEGL